jgi:O-antigen/teichoic acid export membrane protein
MKGEHLVHLQGVQSFLGTLFRSLFQITLVYLGYKLVGMLAGYIASTAVVAVLGFVFVLRYVDRDIQFVVPEKRHFVSMFKYAKFSWLGRLEARTYSWTDLVVLGFFVPSSLVGIYGVCWTLSTVASLFSNALTNTVFPEISKTSAQEGKQKATNYLEESFAYAGLLTIPAIVGATVVGSGVLDIYGDEFSQGSIILVLLMAAVLLHSYQKQLLNALNAVDRPDISFRVNVVFIVTNVVLNVILVYEYGWTGAAVATLISCSVGLLLGYRMVSHVLRFTLPIRRLGYQIAAAILMGVLVFLLTTGYEWVGIDVNDIVPTLFAVSFGASIYFLLLLLLSADFRKIVRNNSPI